MRHTTIQSYCREHPSYLGDFGYLPDDDLFFPERRTDRGGFSETAGIGVIAMLEIKGR